MRVYYNAADNGFYTDDVHGPRQIAAPQTAKEIKAKKRPKMIDNPDCRIPAEAEEITIKTYHRRLQEQSEGKQIIARGGKPVAVAPESDQDHQRAVRKKHRDHLLSGSDWTQLLDSPLADEERGPWQAYRQKLRDLDMDDTNWPEPPKSPESKGDA